MATIFVTAGTQLPFDRLVEAIDNWASENPGHDITVQAISGVTQFQHVKPLPFITPANYNEVVKKADVIIGHAGVGTIITGFENTIPVVVMPRRHSLNEHRNDHQMATVEKFSGVEGIYVALDKDQLTAYLNKLSNLSPPCSKSVPSRAELIGFVEEFITDRSHL